jgi:hypothetical protein
VTSHEMGKVDSVVTVTSHEMGKVDSVVNVTNRTYPCDHLWHRYSVTVNQVMKENVKQNSNDKLNLTNYEPLVQCFLVSRNY